MMLTLFQQPLTSTFQTFPASHKRIDGLPKSQDMFCSEPLGYAHQIGRSTQTSHRIVVVFEQDAKGVAHIPRQVNAKYIGLR